MLTLEGITKNYLTGEQTVRALKGISLRFRDHEFVSILGPSGCGKTTLLNIIGGLDRYTEGDLSVNGRSTREFSDRDWDTYRNHSIGFVFQNYNLIPHQTVLSNVELALTLSGVSKAERRRRAKEVLEQVGLGDQLSKKPAQMSGGQMQRVAIARALVNEPSILLADEPTGALDSETSVQIMEILKKIAEDRLVIMVTHNPDLAERYSSRIIRLLDGVVTDDSNPCTDAKQAAEEEPKQKKKYTSMSFFTAFSLSLNNLMTKKTRTFLTSFAGSIGIIGIALILSLSSGFQNYIDKVEEDTLSSYPIMLERESVDMGSMLTAMMDNGAGGEKRPDGAVYVTDVMTEMINNTLTSINVNDLAAFKEYLEKDGNDITPYTNAIRYSYDIEPHLYQSDTANGIVEVAPSPVVDAMSKGISALGGNPDMMSEGMEMWKELLDNEELLASQYDVVAGRWPSGYQEAVLILNENNEISDVTLYSLGLKDASEIANVIENYPNGGEVSKSPESYSYDDILNLRYKLIFAPDYYEKSDGIWVDKSEDSIYMSQKIADAPELKIVGVIRPNADSVTTAVGDGIGYTPALTEYYIRAVNNSEIVQEQKDHPDTDIFTGMPFQTGEDIEEPDVSTLSPQEQAYLASLSETERQALLQSMVKLSSATYAENLQKLDAVDLDDPAAIYLYPSDFDAKESIASGIDGYNSRLGDEDAELNYTDYIGIMMSSVSRIIDTISYVLIAFVAISLIVSSIMIGIITYISVLERTKEIGILRSIGASKRDISRVFNAETLLVGLVAGLLGILVTVLLCFPINALIHALADISAVAALPPVGGIILVVISMLLTLIAGLIPSRIAAKKDPVEALRTE